MVFLLYSKQTNAIQTIFAEILITAFVHRVRAFVENKEIHLAIAVPNCVNIMHYTVPFLLLHYMLCVLSIYQSIVVKKVNRYSQNDVAVIAYSFRDQSKIKRAHLNEVH